MKRILMLALTLFVVFTIGGVISVIVGRSSGITIHANKQTTFPDFNAEYGKGTDCLLIKKWIFSKVRCLVPSMPDSVVAYQHLGIPGCDRVNDFFECDFYVKNAAKTPDICGIWMGVIKIKDPPVRVIRLSVDCREEAATYLVGYQIK